MHSIHHQTLALVFAAVIVLGSSAPADDEYAVKLQAIHTQHAELGSSPGIEDLVKLDRKLRELIPEVAARERSEIGRSKDRFSYFREEYASLGIEQNHWSGSLEYNGALLKQAHKIDPNSPFRNSTLFSNIEIGYERNGLPGIADAHRYILEFPDGPFVGAVYEILATFYDDLYKSIRKKALSRDPDSPGEYEECFKAFYSTLPFDTQMVQAQSLADHFYGQALEHLVGESPKKQELKSQREVLRSGTGEEWYWCWDC